VECHRNRSLSALAFLLLAVQSNLASAGEASPSQLQNRIVKNVRVNWFSFAEPIGKAFELPPEEKKCTLLKVRAEDNGYVVQLRVGYYLAPQLQKISIEDNLKSAVYKIGQTLQVRFHTNYNHSSFGGIYYPNVTKFPTLIQDKNNENLLLHLSGQDEAPPIGEVVYVCVADQHSGPDDPPILGYFLSDQD
jgi:hypothetical protein